MGKERTKATTLISVVPNAPSVQTELPLDEFTKNIAESVVKTAIEPLKEELSEYKVKMIEVLAVFIALFTFISVDIQIFKSNVSFLSSLGFTLVMLGSLLMFIVSLVYIFDFKNNFFLWISFIISVLLIGGGIYCVSIEYNGIKKILETNFYTKDEINTSKNTKLEEFKKCFLESFKNKGYFDIKCLES